MSTCLVFSMSTETVDARAELRIHGTFRMQSLLQLRDLELQLLVDRVLDVPRGIRCTSMLFCDALVNFGLPAANGTCLALGLVAKAGARRTFGTFNPLLLLVGDSRCSCTW